MSTVHIIGGGISGLSLAHLLPSGWETHLHEAEWTTRQVPTLFGIQAGGQRALKTLGLHKEFEAASAQVTSGQLRDARGRVLTQVKGVDVRLISRTDLLALLREKLPTNVQVRRHHVESPADLQGDLIVGADGVHSRVRGEFWDRRAAPRRLGVTAIRGVIDHELDDVDMLQEVWRPEGLFGLTPRPGRGANWFATVPARHFESREAALESLRARWAGFTEAPQKVLKHATPELTLVNDLWQSRWPGRVVHGRAVLLGDAAHAMAPNLGRGANEALVDAVTLGQALQAFPSDLPRSARRYERRRTLSPQLIRLASRMMLSLSSTRHERLRNALFLPLRPRGSAD